MADFDIDIRLNRAKVKALAANNDMRRALETMGQIAETSAKGHAPVDTGNLRRSITHEVRRDLRGLYMRYGTNVYYGVYQEFGTRNHEAHPFLRPALERLRQTVRGNDG